ncbi:hypothetical protein ONZ45_g14750 [Pleurotus djamor]|nr:hypothetical protein ONZ45_g14750 [Pleurotus djamor]
MPLRSVVIIHCDDLELLRLLPCLSVASFYRSPLLLEPFQYVGLYTLSQTMGHLTKRMPSAQAWSVTTTIYALDQTFTPLELPLDHECMTFHPTFVHRRQYGPSLCPQIGLPMPSPPLLRSRELAPHMPYPRLIHGSKSRDVALDSISFIYLRDAGGCPHPPPYILVWPRRTDWNFSTSTRRLTIVAIEVPTLFDRAPHLCFFMQDSIWLIFSISVVAGFDEAPT